MKRHPVFAAAYDVMSGPLEREVLAKRRERLLGRLTGEILDLGVGTGANLAYLRNAARVVAAEPDPAMRRRLAGKLTQAPAAADWPAGRTAWPRCGPGCSPAATRTATPVPRSNGPDSSSTTWRPGADRGEAHGVRGSGVVVGVWPALVAP